MWSLVIAEAWRNLCASRFRSALALLGIMIGSASVLAMLDIGSMSAAESARRFRELGADLLLIQPNLQAPTSHGLSLADVSRLSAGQGSLTVVAPYIFFNAPVVKKSHEVDTFVIGVTADFQSAARLSVERGRFVSSFDGYERFAVVGDTLAAQLGDPMQPLEVGDAIRIGPEQFKVIGVLQHSVQLPLMAADVGSSVFIPLQAMARLSKADSITSVIARVAPEMLPAQEAASIDKAFAMAHPGQSLTFHTAEDMIATADAQMSLYHLLLGTIAAISMIVGGAGVMNVMLVAVTERRSEIGIRLAIGARRRDIHILFMTEAAVLSLSGGFMGAALGIIISWVIAWHSDWPFVLSSTALTLGLVSAVIVGIVSGVLPAVRAAQLDPIEALRGV